MANYVVTGTLSPDATGLYVENGVYDGKAAYERADGAYWIWWWSGENRWAISTAQGYLEDGVWWLASPDVEGEYTPLVYSGNPTVAAPAPFAIGAATGEITIAEPTGLAASQVWTVTVRATDNVAATDDGIVTITLTAGAAGGVSQIIGGGIIAA